MRISAQELVDFYEHAPCGFHALDPEGLFIHVNQTELDWLGYRYDEMVGRMKLTDILTLEGRQTFERNSKRFKTTSEVHDQEYDFVRRDGTYLPVLVSATALIDDQGRLLMSRSVVYKVAERLRSHIWFRAILDAAPDAMFITSRSGEILLANVQAEKLFGYRAAELRGGRVEMLLPEQVRANHVAHRDKFFDKPKARPMGAGFEMHGRRKDGTEFPVEISLSPLEFDRMLVAVAAVRDLTERRRVEEKARQSQAQYRLLFENSMDGILLTTPDGKILEANPSACRILGRTRDDVLKVGREGVLDTADPAAARFMAEREITGRATGELRGRRADGTLFPQEVSSVIFTDADGKQCSCVIFRETPSRKEAEGRRK